MSSRWEVYNSAKGSTIDKIESGLKLHHFTSSLPAAIAKDKPFCSKVHKLMVNNILSKVTDFAEEVEEQVKLKQCLDQLDEIANDPSYQPANGGWRPSRIPLDNQASRDRPIILNGREKLQESTLDNLDASVTELENKVKELSDEIDNNAQKIDRFIENITTYE